MDRIQVGLFSFKNYQLMRVNNELIARTRYEFVYRKKYDKSLSRRRCDM